VGVTVVALSAERGAGKSTVAAALAAGGARHASVSRWLVARLSNAGEEATADSLRRAGAEAALDPDGLVRGVLDAAGWRPGQPAVFDAIRHARVLAALRAAVAPQRVLHVALTLGADERNRRLAERGDSDAVAAGSRHSTEVDVPWLIAVADIRLDAALPVEELFARIAEAAQALR